MLLSPRLIVHKKITLARLACLCFSYAVILLAVALPVFNQFNLGIHRSISPNRINWTNKMRKSPYFVITICKYSHRNKSKFSKSCSLRLKMVCRPFLVQFSTTEEQILAVYEAAVLTKSEKTSKLARPCLQVRFWLSLFLDVRL